MTKEEKMCSIVPFRTVKYAYESDARKWSSKMMVIQLKKMKETKIAFLFYLFKVSVDEFLEANEYFFKKYTPQMRLDTFTRARIKKISQTVNTNVQACILQKAIRRFLNQKEEKRYLHCAHVVKEFITTEKTYVEQLCVVEELIHQPLLQTDILSLKETELIFNGISVIYGINKTLFKTICREMNVYSQDSTFGKTFLTITPFLKMYSDYCQIYPKINQLVTSLKSSEKFTCFYKKQIVKAPSNYVNFDLLALLITPVQRLPRYKLLLSDLFEHTKFKDVDYSNIKKSLEEIEKVTSFVNAQSKKVKVYEFMSQLDSTIKDLPPNFQLIQPDRFFISTTTVLLAEVWIDLVQNKSSTETMTLKDFNKFQQSNQYINKKDIDIKLVEKGITVEMYLFNDIILFAKKSKGIFNQKPLQFHNILWISKTSFSIDADKVQLTTDDEIYKLTFQTPQLNEEWTKALRSAFDKMKSTVKDLKKRQTFSPKGL
ncbi:guanine nucleotide exchange factor, putative [Entamoeba invadens IP1]|uniref:guanine nucleotide exchange factor, putative n=1 Tax=Entamoeba invadens IP1 TaxID=370355 RepID=UPI0002C3F4ED|nr:guanine nucleotide exchange factor, putative [Entamoeba invadens IP1]ELP93045.1 guanine nucleotide exchange factor, putative [Entamoeba invadens IP1]|eukprot:XP_004259816.1 guanine nucleotide exchange factor, putative [Entamoeba invadens IP1]